MKRNNFRLSGAGKLAASMAIIFASINSTYAGEIVAANSANGPGVSTASNGAQVVNIVTPNGHGLSHNQYQDFNVNQPGAVLNNSLDAGRSQLAGQLGANPNLNNQAASVILNEVISRNPSLLHGQQEIFGMAADYVLANPNGISCDGCGFINTSRSSLVVGNPVVQNGVLQGYSTRNNSNTLNLDGRLNASGVLDLIAPRIDSRGKVSVAPAYDKKNSKMASAINAISGSNIVSRDAQVRISDQQLGTLDSYYLGSMQADRINIINTANGSGVKLSGKLDGNDEIRVNAYNIRTENQVSDSNSNHDSSDNYASAFGRKNINDRSTSQKLARTELKGKNISLEADNSNHLTATDIFGDEITLKGASLTLDGQQLKQTQVHTNEQKKLSWQYDVTRENEQHQQAISNIQATKNATLTATKQDVTLLGAKITAGNALKIDAKRDVQLRGLVELDKTSEHGYQRNHTASLRTGSWSNSNETERLKASDLRAGTDLTLTAGNKIQTQGAKAHAGNNLTVNANDQINIDVQKTANAKAVSDNKTSWGGIGGGNNQNNSNQREISNASELTANGTLRLNGQQGVTITGSKAKGKQGGYVEATAGGLLIDNALSTTLDKVDSRTGTVFNITSSSQKSNNSNQQSTASELVSNTNLQLVSKKDTDVVGSKVTSTGKLEVKAGGNINITAGVQQQRIDEQRTDLSIKGHANEKGDKQYRTGLRIEHTSDSEKTTRNEQQLSTLSGGSVALKADKDVTFSGSKLVTTQGDASISGENISFLAVDNKTTTDTEKTNIGGGIYVTGGIDKAGAGIEASYKNSKTHSENSKAVTSSSDIAGNLAINAKDKLTQQGAQHLVGGKYQEKANHIDHLAAIDSEKSSTHKLDVGVDIGVNVDYSPVTRPLERAVNKIAELDVSGAINEIGGAGGVSGIGAPSIGLDIGAEGGSSKKDRSSSQAVVSSITAGVIDVEATKNLQDTGTKYQTTHGSVTLTADSHNNEAAKNSKQESNNEIRGGASLRVSTTTGRDLNVEAKGNGGNKHSESASSKAVTGSINATDGIDIKIKQDAVFQGTSLNAGNGKVKVKAEDGSIRFEQATDRSNESHNALNIKVAAKAGTAPETKTKKGNVELGGSYNTGKSDGNDAQISNISGKHGVELDASRDLTLQGSNVVSLGDISLKAGEKIALQALQTHQTRKDDTFAGNINVGGNSTNSDKKISRDISVGGGLDIARVDESSTTKQGGKITSGGAVTITAKGSNEHAVHLQGTEVKGSSVNLNAENGSMVLESVQNEEQKNNWSLGLKANVKRGQSVNKDTQGKVDTTSASTPHTIGGGVKVGVDKLQKTTQNNSQITAGDITINSDKDTELSGTRIDADSVQGNIGGDLRVESRKDSEKSVKVNVDIGLNHTNDPDSSIISKLSKVGTPHYADKLKDKMEAGINKVADVTTEKYNSISRRHDSKQDTTGAVSFSKTDSKVTLPEKLVGEKEKTALWDRGARFVGNKSKDSLTTPSGLEGQFKVKADVVNNDTVGIQSAISGKKEVTLNVQGSTRLTGGEIRSQQGEVKLDSGKLEQQDVAGNRYKGGGHVDAAASVGAMMGIVGKSVANQETPIGGYINDQDTNAKAGIFSSK